MSHKTMRIFIQKDFSMLINGLFLDRIILNPFNAPLELLGNVPSDPLGLIRKPRIQQIMILLPSIWPPVYLGQKRRFTVR